MRGGIDLGGTKIQAVVVDDRSEIAGEARQPTPTTGGPAAVISQMADTLSEAADAAKVETARLKGVGVGSPGAVDARAGTVAEARNLSDWDAPFPMAAALTELLGTPVYIGNDVSVAVNAEYELGAGKDSKSLLGVFWGTGVGGGIILNGKQWLGRGGAGEIGHVVVKEDGAKCPCGRHGCMEAYAGRGAMEAKAREEHEDGRKTDLFKIMKKHDRDRLTSGIWERALKAKDPVAEHLIDRAVEALGAGIASAVNLLDVEAVIIGGGLGVRLGEPYAKRIGKAMSPHLFNDGDPPPLRVAALGDLGGAIGAAMRSANRGKVARAKAKARGPRRSQTRASRNAGDGAGTKRSAAKRREVPPPG
jgi:glucokinase